MKRLVLAAVTLSMLATPFAEAVAAPKQGPDSSYTEQWRKKPGHPVIKKPVIVKKPIMAKPHWKHGQKFQDWRRYQRVQDWRRYHLHRPGPGQEWVRVGNDYILVSILTGVIVGIIAAH
jgi:Ni/Co efflux regulator RcnB